MQGIMTVNHNGSLPGEDYMQPKICSQGANSEPIAMEMGLSIDGDRFSSEGDGDIILDGEDMLPEINDVFWEQFLSDSPTSAGGTEEAESVVPESLTKDQDEKSSENGNWWRKNQNMDNLTEQMGQLASESNP